MESENVDNVALLERENSRKTKKISFMSKKKPKSKLTIAAKSYNSLDELVKLDNELDEQFVEEKQIDETPDQYIGRILEREKQEVLKEISGQKEEREINPKIKKQTNNR